MVSPGWGSVWNEWAGTQPCSRPPNSTKTSSRRKATTRPRCRDSGSMAPSWPTPSPPDIRSSSERPPMARSNSASMVDVSFCRRPGITGGSSAAGRAGAAPAAETAAPRAAAAGEASTTCRDWPDPRQPTQRHWSAMLHPVNPYRPEKLCRAAAPLPFVCLVLGAVVAFDWDPVALTPGTISGRIALRADKDSAVGRRQLPRYHCRHRLAMRRLATPAALGHDLRWRRWR